MIEILTGNSQSREKCEVLGTSQRTRPKDFVAARAWSGTSLCHPPVFGRPGLRNLGEPPAWLGDAVGSLVGSGVGADCDGVDVADGTGAGVGTGSVGDGVCVSGGVGTDVGVSVGDGVGDGVSVSDGVGIGVSVSLGDGDGVDVGSGEGAGGNVGVGSGSLV